MLKNLFFGKRFRYRAPCFFEHTGAKSREPCARLIKTSRPVAGWTQPTHLRGEGACSGEPSRKRGRVSCAPKFHDYIGKHSLCQPFQIGCACILKRVDKPRENTDVVSYLETVVRDIYDHICSLSLASITSLALQYEAKTSSTTEALVFRSDPFILFVRWSVGPHCGV